MEISSENKIGYSLISIDKNILHMLTNIVKCYANSYKMMQADELLDNNIMLFKGYEPFVIVKWIDESRTRSLNRLIHGFDFIDFLLAAYLKSGLNKYIDKVVEYVNSYFNEISYISHRDTFAFHDETTALRVENCLKLLVYAYPCLNDRFLNLLLFHLGENLRMLYDEKFFSGYNNHGMFQSLSLLKGSILFSHKEGKMFMQKALDRLNNYFMNSFTSEGIHNENSPMYHIIVLHKLDIYLNILRDLKLNIPLKLLETQKSGYEFINCISNKDGVLLPMGDTTKNYNLHDTVYVDHCEELCKKSKPFIVYPKSGYAFFYDTTIDMYACFSAFYNADYHKHSDDLQIIVDLNGQMLIDPASPGYQYNDPYVQYGRSSLAHNTLTVDGKDLYLKKNEKLVYVTSYNRSEESAFVSGINKRHTGVEHKRSIKYSWISHIFTINDIVNGENKHEYCFNWNFSPGIVLETIPNGFVIVREDMRIANFELSCALPYKISIINGQIKPYIYGFCFNEHYMPEPCPSVQFIFTKTNNVEIEWKLKLFKDII